MQPFRTTCSLPTQSYAFGKCLERGVCFNVFLLARASLGGTSSGDEPELVHSGARPTSRRSAMLPLHVVRLPPLPSFCFTHCRHETAQLGSTHVALRCCCMTRATAGAAHKQSNREWRLGQHPEGPEVQSQLLHAFSASPTRCGSYGPVARPHIPFFNTFSEAFLLRRPQQQLV